MIHLQVCILHLFNILCKAHVGLEPHDRPMQFIHLIIILTFQSRPTPQLCDVSFGCEPVNINKQKKRPAAVTTKMMSNESPRPDLDLPPLPSSLSVTNSLLPEIQPTYKPVRFPPEFSDGSPKKKKGKIKRF